MVEAISQNIEPKEKLIFLSTGKKLTLIINEVELHHEKNESKSRLLTNSFRLFLKSFIWSSLKQ